MNNKLPCLLVAALLLAGTAHAQRGPSFQHRQTDFFEVDMVPEDAQLLSRDIVQNVYVAPGYVTYLQFPEKPLIEDVTVGAQALLDVQVKPEHNAITISPLVIAGHTNMTVVLNGEPYVFAIHVRKQGDIDYRLTYTLPNVVSSGDVFRFGPAVKPSAIDVPAHIRAIETYGQLQHPLQVHAKMHYRALNKAYSWNGNIVYLSDAFGFPEDNLVVLRLSRRNLSQNANYLNVRQIQPYVANTPFPVTAAVQDAERGILFPGQMEKLYVFIQGYGLLADNAFEVKLPPEASSVEAITGR